MKDFVPINWALITHPINWVIVVLMVYIAMIALNFIIPNSHAKDH